ncbi:MAG: MBOAT family O-acyltransferase [Clostridiales Family XIII bacterium]|nr:MBOAT family protein [Clostridia bacterium]MDE8733852.1 MBOAT family protein [Eubacteriales bacterium DFI.9.88]MDY3011074.1 MBOAT family O-acyltransferase [Clostridiales Family XIII bacterium]
MSFTSIAFIGFIILTAIIYFIVPKRVRWGVLLAASYAFYFLSSPKTFIFVLITTISTFLCGRYLGIVQQKYKDYLDGHREELDKDQKKQLKAQNQKRKKAILLTTLFLNIGILAFLKYFRVYIDSIAHLFGFYQFNFNVGILIPLGISFYTFQSISYIIDVYRGTCKPDKNIAKFALFISFFPQIVQGPISRYNQLAGQLYEGHGFDYTRIKFGAQLILWGFFKKVVIADRVGILVNEIFDNYTDYLGFYLIIGALFYTIQIYADFSGGMEIARGVAQIFGIDMVKNFEQPYFSKSIPEFWRRWHITLGQWCRDYIFYPVSLSKTFGKLGKQSRSILGNRVGKLLPVIIAQLLTFLTIGVWHGAEFKYIAYGLYQAVFIIGGILCEPYLIKLTKLLRINTETFSWKLFQILRTFTLIVVGRYFSRGVSFAAALIMMKNSLVFNPRVFFDGSLFDLGLTQGDFRILLVALIIWFVVSLMQEKGISIRETLAQQNLVFRWIIYIAAVCFILIFGIYGSGYDTSGFIYREF